MVSINYATPHITVGRLLLNSIDDHTVPATGKLCHYLSRWAALCELLHLSLRFLLDEVVKISSAPLERDASFRIEPCRNPNLPAVRDF